MFRTCSFASICLGDEPTSRP